MCESHKAGPHSLMPIKIMIFFHTEKKIHAKLLLRKHYVKGQKKVCLHILELIGGGDLGRKLLQTEGKLAFSFPKRQLKPLPQTQDPLPGILGDVIFAKNQLSAHFPKEFKEILIKNVMS